MIPALLPSAVSVGMTSYKTGSPPAKAGAQLGIAALAGAAPRYRCLSPWASASAGVVQLGVRVVDAGLAHTGMAAMEGHA